MSADRIGVFLACLGVSDVAEALALVRKRLSLRVIQVSKLPDHYYSPQGARQLSGLLADAGISADSVVIVHEGESYADMKTVRESVGYLPEERLEERIEYSRRCVDLAVALGAPRVTTHMGVLPEDQSDPGYARLLFAVREVGAYAKARGVTLALETGQETAQALLEFLGKVSDLSVGVNFDPANLVLYDVDDPLHSLQVLRKHVIGVHVKDGIPPRVPGQLGQEVSPGRGKARLAECLKYLAASGYEGTFIIENYVARGAPLEQRIGELRYARRFVEGTLGDQIA